MYNKDRDGLQVELVSNHDRRKCTCYVVLMKRFRLEGTIQGYKHNILCLLDINKPDDWN